MLEKYTALASSECAYLWRLIKNHYVAILAICTSTALFIAVHETGYAIYDFKNRGLNYLFAYGLIPLLIGKFVLGKSLSELGLGIGDYRFWVPANIVFLCVMIPVIIISSGTQGMGSAYRISNFNLLDYIFSISLVMLGWEFIFRGFLLGTLRDSFKEGAILIQMVPFTLLHFNLPVMITYGCIYSGIIYGYISYRGRSFWPAFISHMVINVLVAYLAAA